MPQKSIKYDKNNHFFLYKAKAEWYNTTVNQTRGCWNQPLVNNHVFSDDDTQQRGLYQMTVEQLKTLYDLEDTDFWELRRGGRTQTIITHSACEKIAKQSGIVIDQPQWLSLGDNGIWAVQVTGWRVLEPQTKVWTTGESSPENCKTQYPVAMAEKRAKDRLILKIVNVSEANVMSEIEMDDLERPETNNKLESLQQLEKTRKETNLSVDELKQQSVDLYQTDQIRDLSIHQIQNLQHQLGNGH